MSDPKYTVAELQAVALGLAPHVQDVINPRRHETGESNLGFCLCIFERGQDGVPVAFVSNVTADDLKRALDDLQRQAAENGIGYVIAQRAAGGDLHITPMPPKKAGAPS